MSKLGIITNNQRGVFQQLVIQGASEIASQQRYQVVIHSTIDLPPSHQWLDPSTVDGILVIANAASDDYLREVYRMNMPLSLISYQVPDLPIPVIMSNNAQGMAELVRHVIMDCGRRQIVFIRGIMEQSDAVERETTFRRELMRYNLEVPEEYFIRGDFSPEVAAESMRRLIHSGASFDAAIAADYLMAIAAVRELRNAGIQVPEHVSVVGFGDAQEAEQSGLTTVGANVQELGRRAAYQLISQVRGLKIRGVTRLSVELIVRDTCGCRETMGTL